MTDWRLQQIGPGISRCPTDTDIVECVPAAVLRAQEPRIPASRRSSSLLKSLQSALREAKND
jgi:hypothetical protein